MMRMVSDSLSTIHKEVRLYEMVVEHEQNPQDMLSLELEAFYGLERTAEDLSEQVELIKQEFQLYGTIAGAFLGIVFGCVLIGLSVKRTRKQYEIEDAQCVNCARCFNYCPQNNNRDY